jgi:hypothetical protein
VRACDESVGHETHAEAVDEGWYVDVGQLCEVPAWQNEPAEQPVHTAAGETTVRFWLK